MPLLLLLRTNIHGAACVMFPRFDADAAVIWFAAFLPSACPFAAILPGMKMGQCFVVVVVLGGCDGGGRAIDMDMF